MYRRAHSRAVLAALLWPDFSESSARTNLRSALSSVRRALGPQGRRYLAAKRDTIALVSGESVWVDLDAFNSAIAHGEYEQAVALGHSDLLPGLPGVWVEGLRESARESLSFALAELMRS